MKTRITELLGIEAPILQGAMARIADASLAAAVSEAGGLGIIACGGASLEWIEAQVVEARERTSKPIGANVMLMDPQAADVAQLLADLRVEVITTGRHDPCVGIRATPIAEAMMALVLMDQALRHRAQCGDVGEITPRIPGSIDG